MDNGVKRPGRDSSIEFLKIIAMIAIVISHVTQTLRPDAGGVSRGVT